ncbi:MAG: hypothetical protein LC749_01330 [Actinobacteria bacterium]|nr:hypothetical protein [Actinomycetota bacterium]
MQGNYRSGELGVGRRRLSGDARVLVLTVDDDPHADMVVAELDRRACSWSRVDTAHYPERLGVDVVTGPDGTQTTLTFAGETIPGESVRSIWNRRRRTPLPSYASTGPGSPGEFAAWELRVTVVGDQVFACRIESQVTESTRIDWRRYDLENTPHVAHRLDPDIERRCVVLTRHFGLEFSAIDLIVTADGETVLLELNPNGQWAWIEELTGLPISAAIADVLARRDPH